MLSIFPLLGFSAFETPPAKPKAKTLLYLRAKGIEASGFESSKGFVVRKGSQAVRKEVKSIHRYGLTLRSDLQSKGVLYEKDGTLEFTQDYTFTSPSTAAMVVLARTANGRIEWKLSDGRTLKEIQGEMTTGNDNED